LQKVAIGNASAGSGIVAGAIGSPAATAGAMGNSAVVAKITQNVFGRRDRQPGGEYRRDGQVCSRCEDNTKRVRQAR